MSRRTMADVDFTDTTRPGHPTLWGNAEIYAYANAEAARLGQRPLTEGRTWTWDHLAGFPTPLARLVNANVYLADEVRPWVDHYLRHRRDTRAPVPESVRALILAAKGTAPQTRVAARYGVGATTVARIWASAD